MAAQGEKDRGTHIRDKWDMQATKIGNGKKRSITSMRDNQKQRK